MNNQVKNLTAVSQQSNFGLKVFRRQLGMYAVKYDGKNVDFMPQLHILFSECSYFFSMISLTEGMELLNAWLLVTWLTRVGYWLSRVLWLS